MISATVVGDSLSPFGGHRLTSLQITFPRYILAEGKTHRIISGMLGQTDIEIQESIGLNDFQDGSKNSASSRAIPWKRLLNSVKENPFIPMAWQKEHTGMQGFEYYTNETCYDAWFEIDRCFGYAQYKNRLATDYLNEQWLSARDNAVQWVESMGELKVTKQMINRMLEPYMWHTVLISATEWENFFQLRCPQYYAYGELFRSRKDLMRFADIQDIEDYKKFTITDWLKINKGMADIHMMFLAEAIWDAMNESTPKQLQPGDWHIPYENKINSSLLLDTMQATTSAEENHNRLIKQIVKVSTGMAARASYTVVGDEKEVSYETLIGIHDKMKIQVPFHASPFEHCAPAMTEEEYAKYRKTVPISENHPMSTELFNQYDGQLGRDIYVADGMDMGVEYGWCRNFRGFTQYRYLIETGIM